SWHKVDNAIEYEIWRSTRNSIILAQKIQTVNSNSFYDKDVLSEIYYYWIKSVNTSGSSDYSDDVQGWPELVFQLSPSHLSFGPDGGNASILFDIPEGCQWSVNNSANWISFNSNTFGAGDDQVQYSILPITEAGYRTGNINLFAQCENFMNQSLNHTITQYSCAYSISPSSISIDSTGGSYTIDIIASESCEWDVSETPAWITVISPLSGVGSSHLTITVHRNLDCASRTGFMTVSGENNVS
ncbi:MAG: hypothetical protein OMM_14915, partial [Candidatus Magnetoglobus multicellularis str. Araruama]